MAYSDAEKAEALICLALNKHSYEKTAEQTGISDRSLRRFAKTATKNGVPQLLERAIERLLMLIPENLGGQDWAITLGILMDKWLLLQGLPTERTEGILRRIEEMHDTELDDVLTEAERILARTEDSGGNGQSAS
tara:strand:- start:98 stop:502 length:405 start_codon:yes stop_codon:yes gene_type:complete